MLSDKIGWSKNYKSSDLLNLVKSSLHSYNEEDENYYKPKDIIEWYYEWDFKDYNPNIYSHGFHQYPAKFVPQLARKILRVFTDQSSVVLDNFMGSGTTLIECILLNRRKTIGIELNPFACFMAKVKTTPINPEKLNNFFESIRRDYFSISNYRIHNFYNINFWFKERQIEDLSKLRDIIKNLSNQDVKDFFFLCMSDVVRRVSLTNHNGFKLHRDKNKLKDDFNPDVWWHFENVSRRNISLMADFYRKVELSKTEVEIIHEDSRKKLIEENSVDFILTSPPYGDSRTTVAYG